MKDLKWCALHQIKYAPEYGCALCAGQPVGDYVLVTPTEAERVRADNPLDVQVDGSHYKNLKIQPVEYNHANNIPFIEGCIIKYATRHREKGGAKDVRKIIHFAELLLALEYPDAKT
jgi:hypothetical protein